MTMLASTARMVRLAFSYLVLVSASASMAAELELVRLNACKDIAEVLLSLKRPATSCGTATGVIEQTIRDFATGGDTRLCIMERPPVASLSNFKCIQSSGRGARTTACYRRAAAALLSDYTRNYVKKYSSPVAAYIEEAKKCPGSTGDASRTIDTTFPSIFMPVAEHAFGFNVQFGDTKPGSSMVSHGFARTSPEVSERGPKAIEYVVFADGMSSELEERTSLGNWRLRVDTSSDFAAQFLKVLKRQGLSAYLAFVDIDLQRSPRAAALSKDRSLTNQLSDVVALKLGDEGFEEMSDGDLKRHTGQTREEMGEALFKGMSFGARKLLSGRMPRVRLLMKTSGILCTRSERGAIGAYLLSLDGEEGVQVDFGSISTVVLGFGACASPVDSSREYVRNLAHESKKALLDYLKGR